MKLPATNYPETPKGKRTVKINVYGNIVGYVSGRRFWEFGVNGTYNRQVAEEWKAGASLKLALTGEE